MVMRHRTQIVKTTRPTSSIRNAARIHLRGITKTAQEDVKNSQ